MLGGSNSNLPVRYGASYVSSTNAAANTSDTIFSAASNTRGAWLWWAKFSCATGLIINRQAIALHTAAPNSVTLGDVVAVGHWTGYDGSAAVLHAAEILRPIFVPAGKGAYYTNDVLETHAHRAALYTLL